MIGADVTRLGREERARFRGEHIGFVFQDFSLIPVLSALVTGPDLVLADEPTANLDRKTALRVIDLMKRMRDEAGTTFVFSTHDPKVMAAAEG